MKRLTLLRIASDPVARVCSGVNPIIIPADAVEPAPAKYLGGGKLVDIPDLDLLINGTYQRVDITVSGVSAATVATFRDESKTLFGALAYVGFAWLDDAWQIDSVEWLAVFYVGAPSISSQPAEGGGRTRSITISLGTDFTDRNSAPIALWTPNDQARRSPTDLFFDFVPGYTIGTSRQFGPSDASSSA